MSRQDQLQLPSADTAFPESPVNDGLQIDLRMTLERVAVAIEDELRASPRRKPTKLQLIRLAGHIHEQRQARARFFDSRLLGEPAWDMLLALYYLPQRGEVLTVSSLSLAAGLAASTGLRWQKILTDNGLIKRGPHVFDGRQHLVGLTEQGRLLMSEYLTKLFQCQGGVPDIG